MIGLFRPKILLIKKPGGEYLEKLLSNPETNLFIAESLEEAKNHLSQVNIDAIVLSLDRKNNNLPNFLRNISSSIPIIIVDEKSGVVPKEWQEVSSVFLRKKTAQDNLIKIFFDLLDQRKQLKKAA